MMTFLRQGGEGRCSPQKNPHQKQTQVVAMCYRPNVPHSHDKPHPVWGHWWGGSGHEEAALGSGTSAPKRSPRAPHPFGHSEKTARQEGRDLSAPGSWACSLQSTA